MPISTLNIIKVIFITRVSLGRTSGELVGNKLYLNPAPGSPWHCEVCGKYKMGRVYLISYQQGYLSIACSKVCLEFRRMQCQ